MRLVDHSELVKQSEHFIECLKKSLYFEAHEALEYIWFRLRFNKEDEVLLLRALINAAVSLELRKRGRLKSSKRPWDYYLSKLSLLEQVSLPHREHYVKMIKEIDKRDKEFRCEV